MKSFLSRFLKICPSTGRIKGIKHVNGLTRILLPLIGFAALLWVLLRVINKPSRLNYPCVRTAMPFASGFIGEILLIGLSAIAFMRSKRNLLTSPMFLSAAFVVLGITGTVLVGRGLTSPNDIKIPNAVVEPNQPVGEAKGIFPGRVVWVYNDDATNKNCNPEVFGNGWFLPKNNDQAVIDRMLSEGLKSLTGTSTEATAWDSIFKFYNRNHNKGESGYSSTEKIFIKINTTSSWGGNFSTSDLSKVQNQYYGVSETSPQLILSLLRQLVNVAGVPQNMIYIGDPMKHIYKHYYDLWNAEFPDIHYLDHDGYTNLGRERASTAGTGRIYYSDRGAILKTNVWSGDDKGDEVVTEDRLYKIFQDAEYMINVPMLKGHRRAGITASAKNHFGSHTRENAAHLHNGLVAPTELPNVTRPGYGLYRVQVDLMGHELLGRKNLVYIMDALWCAAQEIGPPKKFYMQPFNQDWSSSVFLSLDPVAIESVGYDFLRSEFTNERPTTDGAIPYVQMEGTDDYLHQCASSDNWPSGITYDPENDGTPIASLGVHEHWNDIEHMQYSRNLGTGNGIELVKIMKDLTLVSTDTKMPLQFKIYSAYPNPFNPSTTIQYGIKESGNVQLAVYDITGRLADIVIDNEYKSAGTHEVKYNAEHLSSGVYIMRLKAGNSTSSIKILLQK